MDVEIDIVVVEISLHLLAIQIEDVQIHNGQATSPSLVAVGECLVAPVEDAIDEGKVVFDFLITLDMEAIGRLGNGSLKIRHVEMYGKDAEKAD